MADASRCPLYCLIETLFPTFVRNTRTRPQAWQVGWGERTYLLSPVCLKQTLSREGQVAVRTKMTECILDSRGSPRRRELMP